jgi:hypothetical protein
LESYPRSSPPSLLPFVLKFPAKRIFHYFHFSVFTQIFWFPTTAVSRQAISRKFLDLFHWRGNCDP